MKGPRSKASSWRALARREIDSALAKRTAQGRPAPRRGDGGRSVARQLFELRSRKERVEATAADRQRARQEASRRRVVTAAERAGLAIVAARREQRQARLRTRHGPVPSLLALAANALAADLPYFDQEELQVLALFPDRVKTEILAQAQDVSCAAFLQLHRRPLVSDAVLVSLLDTDMKALDLSFSSVSDSAVALFEAALSAGGDHNESWESFTALEVHGLPQLVDLDLSFCNGITEDVAPALASAAPGLRTLSLVGNFHGDDSCFAVLKHLCSLRSLRVLDLSSCHWLSLPLLAEAGMLDEGTATGTALHTIVAEHCPDVLAFFLGAALEVDDSASGAPAGEVGVLNLSLHVVPPPPRPLLERYRFSKALERIDKLDGAWRWVIRVRRDSASSTGRALRIVTSYEDEWMVLE